MSRRRSMSTGSARSAAIANSSRSPETTIRVVRRAERVELLADLAGEHTEITGVDADRAQVRARHLDGVGDAGGDVVGVDQQRGLHAERVDLRAERRLLPVRGALPGDGVQQREGMRAGAQRGHAVAALRLEVRRSGETGEVGGTRRGDRGVLVGAPRTHLDQRPALGRADHPGRGGGDGGVVVEDRQRQRLEQHAFGEGAVHGQHRRAGEVQLAFRVAVDVAAEPVVREVGQRVGIEEVRQRRPAAASSKVNSRQRFHEPGGARDHAVAPAFGQPAGEHLERGAPVRGAVAQGRREHGQLVLVGQQCRRRAQRLAGGR